MKKLFFIGALSALLLTACGGEKAEPKEENIPVNIEGNTVDEEENNVVEDVQNNKEEKSETTIDTSVFEYAQNVEVLDSRDLTKHITLKIDLSNDAQAGMGTLNVLNQTFDFLGQADIKGADTIAILVRVNDVKVSQFTVHTAKFKQDDTMPMADLVLAASDIDFVTPEVKSFGETMELW